MATLLILWCSILEHHKAASSALPCTPALLIIVGQSMLLTPSGSLHMKVVVGSISHANETAYRSETAALEKWSGENRLSLSVPMTKKSLWITGRGAASTPLLPNIHEILTWACHTTAMITKAKQHLYGLRPLSSQIFRDFYQRDHREPVDRLLHYLLSVVCTAQLLAVSCPICRSCTVPHASLFLSFFSQAMGLLKLSPPLHTCITYMEYLTFFASAFLDFNDFTYDVCFGFFSNHHNTLKNFKKR